MKERKLPIIAQQIMLTLKDGRRIAYVGPAQIDLDEEPQVEVIGATFVNLIPDSEDNIIESKIIEPTPAETLKIADVTTRMEENREPPIADVERVNGPVTE